MKKAVEKKLMEIDQKMNEMQTIHLYYTTEAWKVLSAQKSLCKELLLTQEN